MSPSPKVKSVLAALLMLMATVGAASGADHLPGDFFETKVQPILVNHCYKCHSAQAEKVKGGLLLDSREGLLKGGDTGTALVPGDADNSKIVIAVRHTDPDLRMPPKEKLSDEQIAIIEQWVTGGAPDPRTSAAPSYTVARELWSTQPLRRTDPPPVRHGSWARDPVDLYILAELEKHNLPVPAPADKSALIRRVYFDLVGLPPSPREVDRFLADGSDQAFAKVVGELLKSPHYGERWGRHWLDLARYADSNGLDQNAVFDNAWRYRDYVIEAFNTDKPYNEFIREQLAGDLLPFADNHDRHQKWTATGFLVLGPKNFAEPNREKLLMDIADEQIDVTSRAFLGLTVSCARCHDHKFDPIPTRDYYALAGIFRSTQTLALEARRNGPARFLSERPLGTPEQAEKLEKYETKLAELERKRDRARQMARELPGGIDSQELDGIVLDNLKAELVGDWKLSNYSTNFVDKNYLHDGNERTGKGKKAVRFVPEIPADGLYELRLAYTARLNRATNVPVRVTSGGTTKTVYLNQTVEPKYDKAFEALGFFQLEKGTNNSIEVLTEGTRGFVVVDALQCLPQDVQLAARFAKKRNSSSGDEGMMMSDVTAARREEFETAVAELMSTAPPPMPMAIAVRDGPGQNSRIHIRGDPERLGEEVPRGFLSVIDHVQTGTLGTDSSGRLALANWIANDANPITARVMVNRIWLHLFGRGLVNTPDNFGSMGEMPSHPELLDYLASEFMANGWSTRKMIHRLMLTSTYGSSSAYSKEAHAIDSENRYYWRMNRKRLDAESLRDAILSVNKTIDLTVGGESLGERQAAPRPNGGNDLLASRRRSLYLPVLRGSLNDLFQVFDFPDPHALSGKRYVTTAPTQALFMMNSTFAESESKAWAEQLLSASGRSEADLVNDVYLAAYARLPNPAEQSRATAFVRNFSNALIPTDADPAVRKRKAVQAFCHAIIESTEFRFLN